MHSRSYITVRYAETDRMGIAHHANYPIWYEIGRTDFIKLFGITCSELESKGIMMPVVNLTSRYIKPAGYEDRLVVRTWCIHASAARIEFSYSVKKLNSDGSETELAYGSTEHGFVDSETFRPCNIRKRMPELFEKLNGNVKEI